MINNRVIGAALLNKKKRIEAMRAPVRVTSSHEVISTRQSNINEGQVAVHVAGVQAKQPESLLGTDSLITQTPK